MTLACPSCDSRYNLDESRVPAAGMSLRCPKCGTTFQVNRQGVVPAAGAVPLPGNRPAVAPVSVTPPPTAPQVFPPAPQAPAPVASVPLPGGGPAAPPVARPAARPPASAAVPLPGQGGSRPAPPVMGRTAPTASVPLPAPGQSGRAPAGVALDPNALFGGDDNLPPAESPEEEVGGAFTGETGGDLDIALGEGDADSDDGGQNVGPTRVVEAPPSLDLGTDLGVQVPAMASPRPPPALNRAPSAAGVDPAPSGAPRPPTPTISRSKGPRYQIRRASGKVFGPFDEERIVRMLTDGELAGNEDVKADGEAEWRPLTEVDVFAAAAPRVPDTTGSGTGFSLPTSGGQETQVFGGAAADPDRLARLQAVYGDRMAGLKMVENIPLAERIKKYVPAMVAGAAVLVLLALGLSLGLTRFGVFGRFLILGPPHATGAAGAAVAKARGGLHSGTYAQLKDGLAQLQRAHAADGLSVDVAGLLIQVAAALGRESPGSGTAELSQAKDLLASAQEYGPHDPDVLRAQVAIALRDNQPAAAKVLLDELQKRERSAESLYLQGVALRATDRAKAKAAFQQAATADPKLAKAHVALAELALETGATAPADAGWMEEAGREAQKALDLDPAQAHARLILGRLALLQHQALPADFNVLSEEASGLSPAQRASALALVAQSTAKANPTEALATLTAALKLDPHNRDALQVDGRLLLDLHKGGEALAALKAAEPLRPQELGLVKLVAEAQIDQGHYADAAQTLAPSIKLVPDDPELATLQGIASVSLGKSEEAEKVLLAAIKANPKAAEAHLALGKLYLFSLNQPGKARPEFEAALQSAPQTSRYHVGMAQFLMAQGDREGAKRELTVAVALDPDNAEAHFRFGELLGKLGIAEAALVELRRAETLDPHLPRLQVLVGEVLEGQQHYPDAIAAYRLATEADAKDAEAWRLLGRALRESGDSEGSIDALHKSSNLDSQNSQVHAELALSQLAHGENGQALLEAKTAVEVDPKSAEAWRAQGRVQLAVGSNQDALLAFDKASAIEPNSAETRALRGQTLTALSQLQKAIEAYGAALQLDPSEKRLLLEIGQLQVRQKDYAGAIKNYKLALEAKPPVIGAYYLMGRALDEAGKTKDAVRYYEQATRLEPDNAPAFKYLGYYYKTAGQRPKATAAFETYLKKRPDAEDKDVIVEEIGFLKGG